MISWIENVQVIVGQRTSGKDFDMQLSGAVSGIVTDAHAGLSLKWLKMVLIPLLPIGV
jgi:hypothetical protein